MSNIPYSLIDKYILHGWDLKIRYLKYYRHSVFLILYSLLLIVSYFFIIRVVGIQNIDKSSSFMLICIANTGLLLIVFAFGLPYKRDPLFFDGISEDTEKFLFQDLKEKEINSVKDRVFDTAILFNKIWTWTFGVLFFYYLFKTFFIILEMKGISIKDINPNVGEFIMDTVNIFTSYFFFLAYILIAIPTYTKDHKKIFLSQNPLVRGVALFAIILWGFDGIVEFMLSNSAQHDWKIVVSIFIGVFSSIIIALFAGRLDSKFMGVPGIWIGLLYLYAISLFLMPLLNFHFEGLDAIKAAYDVHQAEISKTIIDIGEYIRVLLIWLFHLTFLLKLILALMVIWLFRSTRFILYLIQMNVLQFQIKDSNREVWKLNLSRNNIPKLRDIFKKHTIDEQ